MSFFTREHPLTGSPDPECDCLVFLFRSRDLLVVRESGNCVPTWPFSRIESEASIAGLRRVGSLDGVPCFAGRWNGDEVPPSLEPRDLRQLYVTRDDTITHIAGLALHLLHWDETHAFCGVCGARTLFAEGEHARRCVAGGHLVFPRIAPSIIVAVTKNDQLLLARGQRFAVPMYSVLAGFVEPGETLEECVHREVREEVGIEVTDLRYFGSQPWPFPESLMVGFTACYAGGELRPDAREIVDAGWYRRDALPRIPEPGRHSISRQLIDWFLRSRADL